jgi:hypothetical protein
MQKQRFFRGKQLIGCFLLFLSCSTSSPHWMGCQQDNVASHQRCSEITYRSEDAATGLELRFRRGNYGLHGYLSVMGGTIPRMANDPSRGECWVVLSNDEWHYFTAPLFEGEQRLLLEDEAVNLLLGLLEEERPFRIQLPHHGDEIPSNNFAKEYRKFSAFVF